VLEVEDSEFGEAPTARRRPASPSLCRHDRAPERQRQPLQQGFRGHLIKSRARESSIRYNLLVDGAGGSASYELEFPNGGLAWVIGNIIGQSPTTDNRDLVSYGAEGQRWPDNALYLAHNTLVDDRLGGRFLRVWTDRMPPATEVWAINNLLVGHTRVHAAGLRVVTPAIRKSTGALVDADGLDYPPARQLAAARSRRWHPGLVVSVV
jgi:hypothetical protein